MYDSLEMQKRIENIKKSKNLSTAQLAELSGVSEEILIKILSGEEGDPQISNIIKIADAFAVSTDYLIFGKGSASEESAYDSIEVGDELYKDFYNFLVKHSYVTEGEDLTDRQTDILIAVVRIIGALF